jgi:hypothetical protein
VNDTASGGPRFIHLYFADDDRDLYYELDNDGFAVRNLDVDPATGEPVSAVSRPEWNTARDYGDLYEYEAKFGRIAEGNIGEALNSAEPYEVIKAAAFETVWNRCRADLERRWTSGGREAYERKAASSQRWKPLKEREPP